MGVYRIFKTHRCVSTFICFFTVLIAISCTEEDTLSPPVCRLTHYDPVFENDSIVEYNFVFDYDEAGKVVRRTYYPSYSHYQESDPDSYYDSIEYEGNTVIGLYRGMSHNKYVYFAWKFEYTNQYEITWKYDYDLFSRNSDPVSKEVISRDDKHRIIEIEYTGFLTHKYRKETYSYENGNLIQRTTLSYKIAEGDTIFSSKQREEWTEFSLAKSPFKGLPFFELREYAYSDYLPTQYFSEIESESYPDGIYRNSLKRSYNPNDLGYPNEFLYNCE